MYTEPKIQIPHGYEIVNDFWDPSSIALNQIELDLPLATTIKKTGVCLYSAQGHRVFKYEPGGQNKWAFVYKVNGIGDNKGEYLSIGLAEKYENPWQRDNWQYNTWIHEPMSTRFWNICATVKVTPKVPIRIGTHVALMFDL